MSTVDNVEIYQETNKQSGWLGHETLLASGLLGLLVGALLGGIYAIAQQFLSPGIVGILIPTRFGAAFDIIGVGALIGVSFALIVGSILGRDTVEDNNYLYEASLEKGNALVAVFADSTNRAVVEKSIGLRYEFEVRAATN